MGCTIQDYGFTKNGSLLSGSSCNATTSDTIGCRANVYIDTAYGNLHVWFRYKIPSGSYASVNSSVINVTSPGTYTFDANIGTLSTTGNYLIDLVQMVPLYCQASGTPNSCNSLNIGTACTFSTLYIPNISIVAGNTFTLSVSCKDSCGNWINCPSSGFSWSSDNSSIASVVNSSGTTTIVSGISAGTTTVRVSYGGITTSCTVTVTPGGTQPPGLGSIIISPCPTIVQTSQSVTLTATCKDTNGNGMACSSMTWYTSPGTGSVTVNNGVITGVTGGDASVFCVDNATGIPSNSCIVTITTPSCTNPKYKCVSGVCRPDNCDGTGTFPNNTCNNTCGGGTIPPSSGCPGCDRTKNICLDFIGLGCQPSLYVYGAVGLFIALMILKK